MSESSDLPTEAVTEEETVILVRSLLIDWRVLEHLHQKGIIEEPFSLRSAGCCKPDGGSCCVHRQN